MTDRRPTPTYLRLADANPDRDGTADLDGYQIAVVDTGNSNRAYRWSLYHGNCYACRHITGGNHNSITGAWQAACDALDAHKAELALFDRLGGSDSGPVGHPAVS